MRRHRIQVAVTAALLAAASSAALADDTPAAKPAGPKLADIFDATGITETGYVAASYYRSNGYSTFHQFDDEHDSFQLDQAAITLAYQPKEGFGALVNLGVGEDMRVLNAAEQGKAFPAYGHPDGGTFDVVQAFVQYATGPLTIIGGKYVTLAGAEVIAPTGNTNFSRSLLFFAEPLTHTGFRATYAATDTLNLIVGINNGWNTTSTSYGSKTAELGIAYTPNKIFALTAQSYIGKTPGFDAEKILFDAVGTYNVTDSLSLLLSFDWGKQEQQTAADLEWNGAAFYANYAFNDQWRVSGRVEYLDDKDGFNTGTPQTLKEGTVTLGFDPVKAFELRLEFRYDKSGQPTFLRAISPASGVPEFADNQTGFALQGVFKF